MKDESGSASVMGVGILISVCVMSVATLASASVLVARQSVAGAADAAALAAADARSGLHDGAPCERAAAVAASNATTVEGCELHGDTVTVRVSGAVGALTVEATATAGRPTADNSRSTAGPQVGIA